MIHPYLPENIALWKRAILLKTLDIAIEALNKIANDGGKVCAEYTTCEHQACQSSYNSWALADEAIHKISKIDT